MSDALFDTNILIDALKGVGRADAELERFNRRWISRITWIEVMAGAQAERTREIEVFLDFFSVVELTEEIARRAATIRRERKKLRLPDAVIWASAQANGCILVTRNTKDFPVAMPGIRVPYQF